MRSSLPTRLLKLVVCCMLLGDSLVPLASHAQLVQMNQKVLAQEPKGVPSPNASTLGLFGQVPVSQFTGLPSIGIPLHELQEGALHVPVSLSYHASGFRPDMHPGWVGVGWNLSAGGAITRTMRSYPDEMTWPGVQGVTVNYGNIGFLYNFTDPYVNGANWETTGAQRGLINANNASNPAGGWRRDTEPDEFNFNFNGYSGKFYWSTTGNGSTTGKWRVQCDKPIKVETLNPGNPLLAVPFTPPVGSLFAPSNQAGYPKMLGGFVITTEDGVRYQFGGVTSAIEYQVPFFNQFDQFWRASSWYLTSITAPDGRHIDFSYTAEQGRTFINQMYFGYSVAQIDVSHTFNPFSPQAECNGIAGGIGSYGGQLIRPVYLSSITWGSNSLYFDSDYTSELAYPGKTYSYAYYLWQQARAATGGSTGPSFLNFLEGDINNGADSPYSLYNPTSTTSGALAHLRWRKLTGTRHYCGGKLIRMFDLDYTDNSTQRLVLTKVTEVMREAGTALAKPPFVFTYEPGYYNSGSIFSIPYLEDRLDHWGFYNAQSGDLQQLFNSNSTFSAFAGYYALREPNTSSSVFLPGVLTKIRYPTNGTTTFEYEQHRYSKRVGIDRSQAPASLGSDVAAGGLRISKITSHSGDGGSPDLVKRYYYTESYSAGAGATGLSSGILGGTVQYYAPRWTVNADGDANITYQEDVFSTQSALPACNTGQGNHLGYSTVTEVLSDGSYTTVHFTNFDTGNVDDMPTAVLQVARTPYYPYSCREHERGLPLLEEAYSRNDQLVKQKSIGYAVFNKANEFARSMQASYFNVCSNTGSSVYEGASWRCYTYPYLPVQESQTVYDVNGLNAVKTSKEIHYATLASDFHSRLVASETTTDSRGRSLYTTYTYPFNIAYPSSLSPPTDPSAATLYAMVGRNIIGTPVETQQFSVEALSGGTLRLALQEAEAHTFKWGGSGNTNILLAQIYKLTPSQLIDPSTYVGMHYGTGSNSPLVLDTRLSSRVTFDSYDNKGNILGLTKEGQMRSAYEWGYDGKLLISKATNATPGELLTETFEENRQQWDANLAYSSVTTTNGTTFTSVSHTGKYAGRVQGGGQVHSFSKTLTISPGAGRYVFSGWVYSEGPTAQIFLFKNRPADVNNDGSINYYGALNGSNYLNYVDTQVTGRWVFLEQEVDIPGDVTKLTLRLTSFDRDGTNKIAYFDDVRLYPAAAQVTTYTHAPEIGVTSVADVNSKPVMYEYDWLNRLIGVRDQDGNVVKTYQYHYKNQ